MHVEIQSNKVYIQKYILVSSRHSRFLTILPKITRTTRNIRETECDHEIDTTNDTNNYYES